MRIASWFILAGLVFAGGCVTRPAGGPPAMRMEIRAGYPEPGAGLTAFVVAGSRQKIFLRDEVLLTESAVKGTRVLLTGGTPQIELTLTEEGARRFAEITAANVGRNLAILVDGRVVCAPVVRTPISGNRVVISGPFTRTEAEAIAAGLVRRPPEVAPAP
jgi:preprotein translocase subunit SecD